MTHTNETISAIAANPPPAAATRGWLALSICIFAYVFLFGAYYPPLPGIEDEVGFINQALVFTKGSFSAEGAGYPALDDFVYFINGHHVGGRNPGCSLLVAALLLCGGFKSIFIYGATIHIALTLLAGLTLHKLDRSPLWAILILCHPTLALYSRTIMGDTGTALGLLLAFHAAVACRKPGIWVGLAIGLAAVMRYQAGLVLPFAAAALAFGLPIAQPKRQGFYCLLAGGAVGLLIVAYNLMVFGNLIGRTDRGFFGLGFIIPHAIFYGTALLLLWPLMLLAPFLDRSPQRPLIWALTLPIIALVLPYYFIDRGSSWAQNIVIGQRLLQPILPVWIICYAGVVARMMGHFRFSFFDLHSASRPGISIPGPQRPAFPDKLARSLLAGVACVALLAVTGYLFRTHQRHLQELARARAVLVSQVPQGSLIVANFTAIKLVGVPQPDSQYRLINFNSQDHMLQPQNDLHLEGQHFYLALLPRQSAAEFGDAIAPLVAHYQLRRLSSGDTQLLLFEAGGER